MRKMRRDDRQLAHEEAVAILEKGEYGILAITGDEGYPYAVPLSYAFDRGAVVFHSAMEGHKVEAIRKNPKCSFTVIGDTEVLPGKFSTKYESVIAFGKARELEGEEKHQALMALIRKYSPEFLESGEKYVLNAGGKTVVVKIEIDALTGKARR